MIEAFPSTQDHFNIQVESVHERGTGTLNEDALLVGTDLFAVFDGATSLGKKTFPSTHLLNAARAKQNNEYHQAAYSDSPLTGGAIASSTACKVFSSNNASLERLALNANLAIRQQMLDHGVNFQERETLWSTCAAAARIFSPPAHSRGKAIEQPGQLEWVQAGDAFIVLIFNDKRYKVLGDTQDHDYETLSMWKGLNGKRQASGLEISKTLKDQIKKVRKGMNQNYGVLNGEDAAKNFIQSGVESLEGVKEILLFTDGLSIPSARPEKNKDFDLLIKTYLDLGLSKLTAHIRRLESQDSACISYPRFKCHDDIAAIAIQFSNAV